MRTTAKFGFAAVLAVALAGLAPASNTAAPLDSDPLAHLAGRWVGKAVMTSLSGTPSQFKCVVTYLPRSDAPGIKQNLRCDNGADFKLHAATLLEVHGTDVTGRWEDKINSVNGSVKGAVTETGFDVQLAGQFFAARMAVAGAGCDQTVHVIPVQSDMFRDFAAELRKC